MLPCHCKRNRLSGSDREMKRLRRRDIGGRAGGRVSGQRTSPSLIIAFRLAHFFAEASIPLLFSDQQLRCACFLAFNQVALSTMHCHSERSRGISHYLGFAPFHSLLMRNSSACLRITTKMRVFSGIQRSGVLDNRVVIPSEVEESLTVGFRAVQCFAEVKLFCFSRIDS